MSYIKDIMREEFRYVVNEWLRKELPETVRREIKIDVKANKVIVIAGVRRAGKSYLLFEIMKGLMKEGIPRKNLLYINFDDDRLQGLSTADLDDMLNAYLETASPINGKNIFIFLDEIQNVEKWELWIRRVYDSNKYKIFITGSSSKLLSKEIATALVGRNITYVLYPFSFREFLSSKGVTPNKNALYSNNVSKLNSLAMEYLLKGGFPEVALEEREDTKQKILSSYYDAILYRDIVTRYKVSDANRLDTVFRYAISSYASGFSTVKANNYFRSQGTNMSRQTINNFIKYGEHTFLFYQLLQSLKGFKKSNQARKKLYIVDNGIVSLFASEPEYGKLLENAVYTELLRAKENDPSIEIRYAANGSEEVDFLILRGGKVIQAIQVAYELNFSNMDRETRPLLHDKLKLNPKRCIIVTLNRADRKLRIDKSIEIMTFMEWTLHGPET